MIRCHYRCPTTVRPKTGASSRKTSAPTPLEASSARSSERRRRPRGRRRKRPTSIQVRWSFGYPSVYFADPLAVSATRAAVASWRRCSESAPTLLAKPTLALPTSTCLCLSCQRHAPRCSAQERAAELTALRRAQRACCVAPLVAVSATRAADANLFLFLNRWSLCLF